MKALLLAATGTLLMAGTALADTCAKQAVDKKLAGAALTSFMTKCEKDATAACEKASGEKKLAGAAKTSFEKKCKSDAVGAGDKK